MTRPLSNDLRDRVIDAVESGMSRRTAAERFGVAVSTAIKWVRHWRETGSRCPRPQGGDKRSHRIEAHRQAILALVEESPDITLAEIVGHLERSRGLRVAQSTVWRFLDRDAVTFKKKPRTPPNSKGLMFYAAGGPGLRASLISTPTGWSSLTRPGRRRR